MAGRQAGKRPVLLVLAGVNGAGKSSVGGAILRAHGLTWYNPDDFARELQRRAGWSRDDADAQAWRYGKTRLEAAIAERTSFAFETTLGGNTIPRLIGEATRTHDVSMIFCGLASVEMHIERVGIRVRHGGHEIPEAKIRERWTTSRQNLIVLMPHLARLQVFDNSAQAAPDEEIPRPLLVLETVSGRIVHPDRSDTATLEVLPDWARPVVAAAWRCHDAQL
jgi:predicted ABC-type ATPase